MKFNEGTVWSVDIFFSVFIHITELHPFPSSAPAIEYCSDDLVSYGSESDLVTFPAAPMFMHRLDRHSYYAPKLAFRPIN